MLSKELENLEKNMLNVALKNKLTNGNRCFPIYDGIGNIEEYEQSTPKFAYILKEPYDEIIDGNSQGGGWSLPRDCFMKKTKWPVTTWQRIIYQVYGFRHKLKYMEMDFIRNDPQMGEVLRSVAWINLNKMPALTKSSDKVIQEKFKKYWKDIVKKQLHVYSPDVIICGNVFDICKDELFPHAKKVFTIPGKEDMKDITIYENDKALLFDVVHPGIIGKSNEALGYYIDTINEAINKYQHLNDKE